MGIRDLLSLNLKKTRLGARQSGNVFFALFGAVALVGVVGVTASSIMSGPMRSMTNVSNRALSESQMMTNMRLAVMGISQPGITKDCDLDGAVEPIPYKLIPGKTPPLGGGFLPDDIYISARNDAWGNPYGYCVWDHGPKVDDAACGGAAQNRQPGLNTTTHASGNIGKQTAITVISAGPDRVFQTRCEDWATSDANSNGDIGALETPLANKPAASDDLVMSYSYGEAALATSSNWKIAHVGVTGATACAGAGYTLHNGRCYKLYTDNKSWSDARASCQADGGDLVTINDSAENAYIDNFRYTVTWIGLTDEGHEGIWTWGTPSTYFNWDTDYGQPDNAGGTDNCGRLNHQIDKFDDTSCDFEFDYVCEKSGVAVVPGVDFRTGLVAEYSFNENTGTNAMDTSGNNVTATLSNAPTWVTGAKGSALDFNGTNQYVGRPIGNLNLTGNKVTVSAWFKADVTTGLRRIVTAQPVETSGEEKFSLLINDNKLQFWIGTTIDGLLEIPFTSTGSWQHVVGVYDGVNMLIYLNGAFASSTSKSGNLRSSASSAFQIGRYGPTWGQYFDGAIDEVRVYDRVLSESEIAQIYSYTAGNGGTGSTLDVVMPESKVEVGGDTTVAGGVSVMGGIKLADQLNSGACNEANDLSLRINKSVSPASLEICHWNGGAGNWATISGGGVADPLKNGLVAHWNMEETTGTNVADSVGSNNGTWSGETIVSSSPGKQGNALNFDGVDNVVLRPAGSSSIDLLPRMTVSMWVYPRTTGGGNAGRILDKYGVSGTDGEWTVFYNTALRFQHHGWTTTEGEWGGSTLTLNAWNNVIISYDTGSTSNIPAMYVNGSPVAVTTTSAPTGTLANIAKDLRIGNNSALNRGFDGLIDDVRIYNRILSPEEATKLYLSGNNTSYCSGTGYSLLDGRCYKLSAAGTTWPLAASACRAEGADLATINNAAELNTLNNIRGAQTPWVGYWDAAANNTWVWLDSSSTYTNWAALQPTNGTNDCAYMTNQAGALDDILCSETWPRYICEKAPVTLAATSATLAGWWKMDETSGTSVADSAGASTGTWNGSAAVQNAKGKIDGALDFQDGDDYINMGANSKTIATKKITYAAWIYPRAYEGSGGNGIMFQRNSPSSTGFYLAPTNRTVNLNVSTTGNLGGFSGAPDAVPLNTWSHIAFSYDGGDLANRPKFYVNGAPIAVSQWSAPSGTINMTGTIFMSTGSGGNFYNGLMDDVRVYDGILSADELNAVYVSGMKPVGQSARERFIANQKFGSTASNTGSTLDSFSTGISLQSNKRGDEAGVAMRIDTTQADNSPAATAVTGVLAGNSGQGALNFKTYDAVNDTMLSRMTMDYTGSIGINTSPILPLSSKIQVNELAKGATAFDASRGNCIANKGTSFQFGATRAATVHTQASFWDDGRYLYTAEGATGIRAYSRNGATLNLLATNLPNTAGVTAVGGDQNYIYAGQTNSLTALTFNGTTFTQVGTLVTGTTNQINSIWTEGGYIYVSNTAHGTIDVYSFNGTVFTKLASDTLGGTVAGLWGDGSYIYAGTNAAGAGLVAYRFDGISLERVAGVSASVARLWSDGAYVYTASYNSIKAWRMDGSTFTEIASIAVPGSQARDIWGDGVYLYAAEFNTGVSVYKFDGTAFTKLTTYDTPNAAIGVYGDRYGLYVHDTDALITLNGFECTALSSFNPAYTRGLLTSATVSTGGTCTLGGWTARSATAANSWSDIAYGNGTFVAVSHNGTNQVMTSPDGITWTARSSPSGFGAVEFGNGLFVAVEPWGSRNMATSPDGITWTSRPNALPANLDMSSFTYGNGRFVAVGGFNSLGNAATSTDGITWTMQSGALPASQWWDVAYGNGVFVAVDYRWDATNRVVTSPDGITWTPRTGANSGTSQFHAVAFGNGRFVAVASGGGAIYSNDNGATWAAGTGMPNTDFGPGSIAYGNGRWMAVGGYGGTPRGMTSPDGITWTPLAPVANNGWTSLTFGNGTFVAVSEDGTNRVMTTTCPSAGGYSGPVTGFFGAKGSGANATASMLYSRELRLQKTAANGATPTTTLMFDSAGTMSLPDASLTVLASAATHFGFYTHSNTPATAGKIVLQKSRGTMASPLALSNNDLIGGLTFTGFNTHANSSLATSNGHNAIMGKVVAAPSAGIVPVDLYFGTSATGAASTQAQMVLTNTKRLGVGLTAPTQALDIVGALSFDNGLRIGMDTTCVDINDAGVLRMNGGALEYCNGSGAWTNVITGAPAVVTERNYCPYSTGYLRPRGSVTHASLAGATDLVALNQDYVLGLGATSDYLVSINISDPDAPAVAYNGNSSYIDNGRALAVSGNYAYVVSGTGNYFTVYNVKNPTSGNIVQVKYLAAGTTYINDPRDIKIKGNYAFVSNVGNDIISVFDITDPYNPIAAATFTNAGLIDPEAMFISGDYLYVAAAGDSRLMILNISNPLAITVTGSVRNPANMTGAMDVEVVGNYAYVAAANSDILSVIDVSNPATPTFVRSITSSALSAFRLARVNDHLFLTTDDRSIASIDIMARTTPVLLQSYRDTTALNNISAVTFTGKYLAVTAGGPGSVTIFDIGCDDQPPVDWRNLKKTETVATGMGTINTYDYYGSGAHDSISGPYTVFGAYGRSSLTGALSVVDTATGVHQRWITSPDAVAGDYFGAHFTVSGNLVLATNHPDHSARKGAASVYNIESGSLVSRLVPSTVGAGAEGISQDLSGTYAVIGDPNDDTVANNAGAAYLFDAVTGGQLAKLAPTTLTANARFGTEVDISDNYLAISGFASNTITVYVFDITSRALLYTKTIASPTGAGAIGMDGNIMVVGAPYVTAEGLANGGRLYIYDLPTGTLVHTINAADVVANLGLGFRMTVSGKYAAVWAPFTTAIGEVYIFDISSGNMITKLLGPTHNASDYFGFTASMKNNVVAVGEVHYDGQKGRGYLYYGAATPRQKSDVDCYPQPFDFRDIKGQTTSASGTTNIVKLNGISGNCVMTVATESGTMSWTKNGVAVTTSSTPVKNGDKIAITLTAPSTYNASFRTIVTLGDQTDVFISDTNTGFFVLSNGTYTGGLGGLTGANAICYTEVTTNNWLGKSSAGTITANRVKAFLCDTMKCNNPSPTTTYSFASAMNAARGGAQFTTSTISLGPGNATAWNGATYFGSDESYYTGNAGNTSTLWDYGPHSNTCVGFTIGTNAASGRWGGSNSTDGNRWSSGNSSCHNLQRLICMVDAQ